MKNVCKFDIFISFITIMKLILRKVRTTKNSWFSYRLLHIDFYLYVNLTLHTNFIYRSIIYRFYIQIYYIPILYMNLLPTNPNPYVITYRSKSVCNYQLILHTDSLHTNFTYGFITYEFYIQILHRDPNPY